MGTAKLMPWAIANTAVLMPTTRPRESTSGPPELPGLSATSVWMMPSMSRPAVLPRTRSPGGAAPARRHGRLELERIANGDDELAHPQPCRLPQAHRGQRRRVDLDERQIGARVLADERRLEPATLRERDL